MLYVANGMHKLLFTVEPHFVTIPRVMVLPLALTPPPPLFFCSLRKKLRYHI